MRIYFIGYRGSGKSIISQKLSEEIKLPVYSIDKIIENKENKKINDIVEDYGWRYFREKETSILFELSKIENCIIDCGGGIIEKKENRDLLKKEKYVFFLYADMATLKERLKDKKDRPSLTGEDFIKEIDKVYSYRLPLYKEVAKFVVDSTKNPDEIIKEILKNL